MNRITIHSLFKFNTVLTQRSFDVHKRCIDVVSTLKQRRTYYGLTPQDRAELDVKRPIMAQTQSRKLGNKKKKDFVYFRYIYIIYLLF